MSLFKRKTRATRRAEARAIKAKAKLEARLAAKNDARRIKADPALKHIPIIVVTSYALSGDEAKARAAGGDAYVGKPYSPRALLAKIREYAP